MDISLTTLIGFALAIIIVAIVAVLLETTEETISRLPFLGWFLAFTFLPAIVSALAGTLASLVVSLAIIYPVYQRYVRRARDAGMGKTIVFLSVIPIVSLVTTLILLFAPGVRAYGPSEGRAVFNNAG